MNEPGDPATSAVERLLQSRAAHAPPPALRTRVLGAVANALEETIPGDADAWRARPSDPSTLEWLPVSVALAAALSVLLVTTLSRHAASESGIVATDRRLLTLTERARAAGVSLDAEPPSPSWLAGRAVRDGRDTPADTTMRSVDTRLFLQGEL